MHAALRHKSAKNMADLILDANQYSIWNVIIETLVTFACETSQTALI